MDCIFCKINSGEIPSRTIYEDEVVRVFLDNNPTSDGHLLIIPKKHFSDYLDIDMSIYNHIMLISKRVSKLLLERLKPDGLRLLTNYGINQDVKHFHLHVIPNYKKQKKSSDIDDIYKLLK